MSLFDFIYAEEKLTIEKLQSFDEFKTYNKRKKSFIPWLFSELSKMDVSRHTKPQYKQTIFIKICELLHENITTLDQNESADVLYHLSQMLISDLQNLKLPLSEIQILLDSILLNLEEIDSSQTISFTLWAMISLFEKRGLTGIDNQTIEKFLTRWHLICINNPSPENLSMALNGIAMLYASGYLSKDMRPTLISYFNAFHKSQSAASANHIASYFSSINKLIMAKKIDGIDTKQARELFVEFVKKSEDADPQDIIIVLSTFVTFIKKIPHININYLAPHLNNLLFKVIDKLNQTDGNNIADLLDAIAILVEHDDNIEISLELTKAIFDQWFQHCGHDQECIANGLISVSNLVSKRKLVCDIKNIVELYKRVYSNPYLTDKTSEACLWSLQQLISSKHFPSLKEIDGLIILMNQPPLSEHKHNGLKVLRELLPQVIENTIAEISKKTLIPIFSNENILTFFRNIVDRLSERKVIEHIDKEEILLQLCDILPFFLESYPIKRKDCAYILNKIVLLLSNELNNVEIANLPLILNKIFPILLEENNYKNKQTILWALVKLTESGKITLGNYIERAQQLINDLYTDRGQLDIDTLAYSVQSITKLIELGLPGINKVQADNMLHLCYAKCIYIKKLSDLVTILWSTEKLNANIPHDQIEKLLHCAFSLYKYGSLAEISSIFNILATMIEKGNYTNIPLDKLALITEPFFKNIKMQPEIIANFMWSFSFLTKNHNLRDQATAYSLVSKLFKDLTENYDIIYPEYIIKSLQAIIMLSESEIRIDIDRKKIENLINKFIDAKESQTKDKMAMKVVVDQLISKHYLTPNKTTQKFYTFIFHQGLNVPQRSDLENNSSREKLHDAEIKEVKNEAKESEDKLDSIKLDRDRLADVLDVAQTIRFLTDGKEVFLGGSGAANAALAWKEHKSDYDIRLFDLTEADKDNLYNHFSKIARPGTCKKIAGEHPKIQFELEINGKIYFFQIATSLKKNPGETAENAMFRMVNNGGINLESLYVPLTQDSPDLELKGSRFDISTFKQNRISIRDKNYFKNDPLRILRFIKKELDYYHHNPQLRFQSDADVRNLLRDKNIKNIIREYLKSPANISRFSNTLQSMFVHHSLYDVIMKMNNVGIINAIINLSTLSFDDLKSTVGYLKNYDQQSPENKQIALSYFLLSHFCRKHKHLPPAEQQKLLDHWQLKDLIWSLPNSDYPVYQDYITRLWFENYPTKSDIHHITDPLFIGMLNKVNDHYHRTEHQVHYSGNRNPLFAAERMAPQTENTQRNFNSRYTR